MLRLPALCQKISALGEPEEQDLGCAQEGWSGGWCNESELPSLLIRTQILLNPVRSLPSTSLQAHLALAVSALGFPLMHYSPALLPPASAALLAQCWYHSPLSSAAQFHLWIHADHQSPVLSPCWPLCSRRSFPALAEDACSAPGLLLGHGGQAGSDCTALLLSQPVQQEKSKYLHHCNCTEHL